MLVQAGACPWPIDKPNVVGCYRQPFQEPFARIYVVKDQSDVLWHELGHAFDHADMSATDRDRIRWVLRDFRPWSALEELFADQYAACATHDWIPPVSYRQHVQICRVIWLAA